MSKKYSQLKKQLKKAFDGLFVAIRNMEKDKALTFSDKKKYLSDAKDLLLVSIDSMGEDFVIDQGCEIAKIEKQIEQQEVKEIQKEVDRFLSSLIKEKLTCTK